VKGRRVETHEELSASEAGAYMDGRVLANGERFKSYWYRCPGCGEYGVLAYDPREGPTHEVDENDDGTITVEPKPGNSNSILHVCGWHGYIDHGEWRPA
jgi:phage terminase large subunit GpA-like protein